MISEDENAEKKGIASIKKKVMLVVFIIIMLAFCFLFPYFPVIGTMISNLSASITEDGLYWKGVKYVECSGAYTVGKTLAVYSDDDWVALKSVEGNGPYIYADWAIASVQEDETHTFLVKRDFSTCSFLCVRKNYTIPTEGKVTAVFWNGKKITAPPFCQAVGEIYMNGGDTFKYETYGIDRSIETQVMKSVYLCYEDCPVGTNYIGHMGKVNDMWAITVDISKNTHNEAGSPKPYTVVCKFIPASYGSILQEYFN